MQYAYHSLFILEVTFKTLFMETFVQTLRDLKFEQREEEEKEEKIPTMIYYINYIIFVKILTKWDQKVINKMLLREMQREPGLLSLLLYRKIINSKREIPSTKCQPFHTQCDSNRNFKMLPAHFELFKYEHDFFFDFHLFFATFLWHNIQPRYLIDKYALHGLVCYFFCFLFCFCSLYLSSVVSTINGCEFSLSNGFVVRLIFMVQCVD